MANTLIEVKNLKKYFYGSYGALHAVDDVSFKLEKGKTLGVVGESGCGKSTLGRTMIHLYESTGGQIIFNGKDVTHLNSRQIDDYRRQVGIIFQDPYSSLNPRMTAEQTISEAIRMSKRFKTREEIQMETYRVLDLVGVNYRFFKSYPHELDGGRRQRIGIGRALAMHPQMIVCDEPVSALDVSIQAQILNLLLDLQQKMALTYVFITHNMAVVRYISDSICVMYLGQMVETCPTKELFTTKYHPYTKALVSAIPTINVTMRHDQQIMKGELTSPINPAPGCRFAARCDFVCDKCHEPQHLEELTPNHFVACCRAKELNHL